MQLNIPLIHVDKLTLKNRCLLYTVFFLPVFITIFCSSAISDEFPKKLIRYGMDMQVILEVEIKDAKATIDYWIREFFDGAGLDCETVLYKDPKRFINDFKNGKIDVATTTPLNYLQLLDYSEPDVAFLPVQNGKTTVQYIILARSDIDLSNIKAINGKQLSMKKDDDIGKLFLETFLLENEIADIDSFFEKINTKTQHSQAILSVFFGQADMCVTLKSTFDTMVALNPQVGRELKEVARSQPLVSVVVFFHKNSGETLKNIFVNTIKNILQSPRGRQFLVIFKLENMIPVLPEDLNSLKDLVKKNSALKRKSNSG